MVATTKAAQDADRSVHVPAPLAGPKVRCETQSRKAPSRKRLLGEALSQLFARSETFVRTYKLHDKESLLVLMQRRAASRAGQYWPRSPAGAWAPWPCQGGVLCWLELG
jgi:hypothetical protein